MQLSYSQTKPRATWEELRGFAVQTDSRQYTWELFRNSNFEHFNKLVSNFRYNVVYTLIRHSRFLVALPHLLDIFLDLEPELLCLILWVIDMRREPKNPALWLWKKIGEGRRPLRAPDWNGDYQCSKFLQNSRAKDAVPKSSASAKLNAAYESNYPNNWRPWNSSESLVRPENKTAWDYGQRIEVKLERLTIQQRTSSTAKKKQHSGLGSWMEIDWKGQQNLYRLKQSSRTRSGEMYLPI